MRIRAKTGLAVGQREVGVGRKLSSYALGMSCRFNHIELRPRCGIVSSALDKLTQGAYTVYMSARSRQLEQDRKQLYAKKAHAEKMLAMVQDWSPSLRRSRQIKYHSENLSAYEDSLAWIANELEIVKRRRQRSLNAAEDYRKEIIMLRNAIKWDTGLYRDGLKNIQEMPPTVRGEILDNTRRIVVLEKKLKELLIRQANREAVAKLPKKEKIEAIVKEQLDHQYQPLTANVEETDMQKTARLLMQQMGYKV